MRAKIHVFLKPGVLDVQGKAVEQALHGLGWGGVDNVRVGRTIEFDLASGDAGQAGDRTRSRRAAPFFVHFEGGIQAQLEEMTAGIDEFGDALTRGQAALFVLRLDGFCAAALADALLFILDFGEEINEDAAILLEVGRVWFDVRLNQRIGQRGTSPKDMAARRFETPHCITDGMIHLPRARQFAAIACSRQEQSRAK